MQSIATRKTGYFMHFLKFCFTAEGFKSYQSLMSRTYTQNLVQAFAESWISAFMSMQSVGSHFLLQVISFNLTVDL